MPRITLPDGNQKVFDQAVSVLQVAESIGPGLAKAALAGKVGDVLVDVSHKISNDQPLSIITSKDEQGLEIIRHSAAHLLAQAVKRLFPSAQVTIGPVIENGFYYDFAFERAFTTDDLANIELEMAKIVSENHIVKRSTMSRNEAVKFFTDMGELYKAEIIKDIPETETLSLYQQGEFIDLCRGPHVPSTGMLKAFKLTKVAGAYWRGKAENAMLQRIYGTAWADPKQLKAHLHQLEEAQKRDHRKIGKALDLFHMQEEAPGMIFWHAKGWTLYQAITKYMRQIWLENGYQEVNTPQVVDRILWDKSGHTSAYSDNMFSTEIDERIFAIKPMNCPCHVQIFNNSLRSYRELPIRIAEFGACHRKEPSGTLHGLMRVRGFAQDDAHIFCTEDQIEQEAETFNNLLFKVYNDFGFTDVTLKLSTRPEKRVGSEEVWDKAEKALENVLNKTGMDWQLQPGEGAFYGPKIEYSFKDCMGRVWQLGTLQLDFMMPERLGAQYIAEDSSKKTAVILHRAIFGSLERFLGILIEHYAGKFPVWLAPVQVAVLNISEKHSEFVNVIAKKLQNSSIRVQSDLRNEKIGFKIREHTLQKVPFLLIVGDQEVASQEVTVRSQSGENLGNMTIEAFIQLVNEHCAKLGKELNSLQEEPQG